MSPDDFRRDMLYHAALSIGITLLEMKLLSQKDFARIRKLLLKKYDPYLGKLLSGNAFSNANSKQKPVPTKRTSHKHVTVIPCIKKYPSPCENLPSPLHRRGER